MAKKVYIIKEPGEVFVMQKRNYGCLHFIGDAVLTVLTGGLWLIWVFVREMRRK